MRKIIIFIIISMSVNCYAQFIPSIIGSITYDRKIRRVNQSVIAPPNGKFSINFDQTENPTITDLRGVLASYSQGQVITIQKEAIGLRTGQAFYISANSTNVVLKYTTSQSLDNAVYTYLNMIGINWYGAGENWLVKQDTLNVLNIAGEWKEPTFRNRIFAGTGGLEYPLSIDPNYNFRNNWYAWKRRIRINADFTDGGHVGNQWYQENKALLDANPQWFNSLSGRINGRLKIEVPEAMSAFKTWATRGYNAFAPFTTIAVDPEDGRGGADDPLPPNGFDAINNWNHADKWWWLANETSKLFDENNKKVQVNAYAYGDGPFNVLVPKFTLRKNVYPIIIPYAFQTAYLPNQMVRTWARTITGTMGIYDYWNITQWSLGMPGFNIYEMPEKLNFWRANKVDGMNIETTDAGGPMGHAWWLGAQLQWDLGKNTDTLFKKYLVDCFGAGWQPMKNMFNRWSLNYQAAADVNFSLKDLKDATDLVVVNSPQWKRIADLKAYVRFMKLMSTRNPNSQPSNDTVYQYMYSIHQRMMVHTVGITGQQYFGPSPVPASAYQLTDADVEANFVADLAALPVEYALSNFVFDYDKATYIDSIPLIAWSRGIFAGAQFKAKTTGTVSIDIGAGTQAQGKVFTQDSVYINEQVGTANFTFTETLYLGQTWNMRNYQIPVIAGQTFSVGTSPGGLGRVRMRTPGIILFVVNNINDFDNSLYPLKYFYVPLGTTKIAYRDDLPQPFNGPTLGYLIPPGGTGLVRTATTAPNVYTVNVPVGQAGKVWKAQFGHSGWNFINIPNISTLQLFSYNENP